MKNHKEMFEALLAGETLVQKIKPYTITLINDVLTDQDGDTVYLADIDFKNWSAKPKTININGFEVPESIKEEVIKEYEVWSEGYRATGEHGTATFHGIYKAESFKEAVKQFQDTKCTNPEYINLDKLTYWGCKFFDNETDARKSFG